MLLNKCLEIWSSTIPLQTLKIINFERARNEVVITVNTYNEFELIAT